MLTLLHPWLLLVLPLPLILGRVVRPYHESREALRVPFLSRLIDLTGRGPETGAAVPRVPTPQKIQISASWILIVLALCRPQWIGEPIVRNQPMRDLLLAVDLSGSMETKDFTDEDGNLVDRLTAVKQVLDGFLARREGDRVGLILFGTAPFLQVPFTEDLEVCRQLLDEAQVRMAGPKTAVGDSIGLAINLFEGSEVERRVMILLTDGNDTASQIPPENAARIAADKGITIHTIGAGDPEAVGEQALDEVVLQSIAETTGGQMFRAEDREGLEAIYTEIDALETRDVETVSYRPRSDLFHWFLAAALLLNMLFHVVSAARHRRQEFRNTVPTQRIGARESRELGTE